MDNHAAPCVRTPQMSLTTIKKLIPSDLANCYSYQWIRKISPNCVKTIKKNKIDVNRFVTQGSVHLSRYFGHVKICLFPASCGELHTSAHKTPNPPPPLVESHPLT